MLENTLNSALTTLADLTIIDYNKLTVYILDETQVSTVDLPINDNSRPIIYAGEKCKGFMLDDFKIRNSHRNKISKAMLAVIDFFDGDDNNDTEHVKRSVKTHQIS